MKGLVLYRLIYIISKINYFKNQIKLQITIYNIITYKKTVAKFKQYNIAQELIYLSIMAVTYISIIKTQINQKFKI